jgi:hypothetical protein
MFSATEASVATLLWKFIPLPESKLASRTSSASTAILALDGPMCWPRAASNSRGRFYILARNGHRFKQITRIDVCNSSHLSK